MRTVVILSPTPTHPIDFGNRKRIYNMARELQDQGFRIHFILYPLEQDWRNNFPTESYDAMREQWDEFHIVSPTVPIHKSASGEDHELDEWWDPALEKFLWWYLRSRRFDALIVNYIYLSRALTLAPPSTLKVLDTHDRFGGRRELLDSIGIAPEFFHLTERAEEEGLARADVVISIKPEEQSYFDALGARHTLTIPFAETVQDLPVPAKDPDGYLRVGMIGGRNSINRVNTEKFLDTAIPAIFSSLAPVKFVIGGTMCKDLRAYGSKICVDLLGPVDSVSEFYENVDCVVVPMQASSGQKIKVGEALGYGVPLISHAHAFEGYVPSHPLHTLKSIEEITEAIIDLSFEQDRLEGLRIASQASGKVQQEIAKKQTERFGDIVKFAKPKSLFLACRCRFREDKLFRHHLLQCMDFASSRTNALLHLTPESEPLPLGFEAERDLEEAKRCGTLVPSEWSLSDVFASADVTSVWSFMAKRPDLAKVAPDWSGVFMAPLSFTGPATCAGETKWMPNLAMRVGQIASWYGTSDEIMAGKAQRTDFATRMFSQKQGLRAFSSARKTKGSSLFLFAERDSDKSLICALLQEANNARKFGYALLFCTNKDLAVGIQNWAKEFIPSLKLILISDDEDTYNSLDYTPTMQVDLAPNYYFAAPHKNACLDTSCMTFVRKNRIVSNGIELQRGSDHVELFKWFAQAIAFLKGEGQKPDSNFKMPNSNGLEALFNFLDIHMSMTGKRQLAKRELLGSIPISS